MSTLNNPNGSGLKVAENFLTGQNAAVANLLGTYTPKNTGMFKIGGYVNITVATSVSLNVEMSWTDYSGTAHASSVLPTQTIGAAPAVAALTSTGYYAFGPYEFRAQANTTIILLTAGTFTTTTYDFGGVLEQFNI